MSTHEGNNDGSDDEDDDGDYDDEDGYDLFGEISSKNQGVSQEFIDSLDRIPKTKFKPNDSCAICRNEYLSDPYPLVVKLNNCNHMFDLECVSSWLKKNPTCPMCRKNVNEKRKIELPTGTGRRSDNSQLGNNAEENEEGEEGEEEEDEDDPMNMYG